MSAHLLAVDAGTGSCRAVLFDADLRQAGVALREWTHPAPQGVPGGQDFDVDTNWRLICECIREVLATAGVDARDVAAVSGTSMREGIVLFDRSGRELWACPNVDGRAGEQAEDLVTEGVAQEIYDTAGDWVAITSPPRLRWLAAYRPDVVAAATGLGLLSDWIGYRLCGELVTEPSCGSSSGMFDLARRDWSPRIAELSACPPTLLPPVIASGTRIGGVTEQAARDTGLAAGTPVVTGGADTQIGLLGLGTRANEFTVMGGTFWQSALLVDRPLIDPGVRLRTLCHVVPGQWMIEGIGFLCGLSMRWLRDAMFDAEVAAAAHGGPDAYEVMERRAATIPPGANGVLAILSNVMNARSWRHASPSFLQFDLGDPSGTGRAACVRAVQEAAAYVARAHRDILQEVSGLTFDRAVFTGGAAKGRTWTAIMAAVLGVPVEVPTVTESSALGTAVAAGAGIGMFDLGEVDFLRDRARTVEPNADAVAVYDETYERWREVYRAQLQVADDGLLTPLWAAAGSHLATDGGRGSGGVTATPPAPTAQSRGTT